MSRRTQYLLFALWVILLASTPLWASNYVVRLAVTIAMFTALSLSWNFIGGFTGYPSFSTAAFFGLGCYAGALSERAGVPMLLAWGIATLFVGAFAAALGAIIATGLAHLLVFTTPRPRAFFAWIVALATTVAVALPFAQNADLDAQIATAIVNLVIGISIMTLIGSVISRTVVTADPMG